MHRGSDDAPSNAGLGNNDKPPRAKVTRKARKYKKAPGAPKRFRSPFIFFSQWKHKQIQEDLAKEGGTEKTTNVAKKVSGEWRSLSEADREKWEKMAAEDKERFGKEKASYRGPWTVPIGHRKSKDPSAPKRPASAFLAFSNSRRRAVKQENQDSTNAEISRILSTMWKNAPDDIRKRYCEEEAEKREQYKIRTAEWRENEIKKRANALITGQDEQDATGDTSLHEEETRSRQVLGTTSALESMLPGSLPGSSFEPTAGRSLLGLRNAGLLSADPPTSMGPSWETSGNDRESLLAAAAVGGLRSISSHSPTGGRLLPWQTTGVAPARASIADLQQAATLQQQQQTILEQQIQLRNLESLLAATNVPNAFSPATDSHNTLANQLRILEAMRGSPGSFNPAMAPAALPRSVFNRDDISVSQPSLLRQLLSAQSTQGPSSAAGANASTMSNMDADNQLSSTTDPNSLFGSTQRGQYDDRISQLSPFAQATRPSLQDSQLEALLLDQQLRLQQRNFLLGNNSGGALPAIPGVPVLSDSTLLGTPTNPSRSAPDESKLPETEEDQQAARTSAGSGNVIPRKAKEDSNLE